MITITEVEGTVCVRLRSFDLCFHLYASFIFISILYNFQPVCLLRKVMAETAKLEDKSGKKPDEESLMG